MKSEQWCERRKCCKPIFVCAGATRPLAVCRASKRVVELCLWFCVVSSVDSVFVRKMVREEVLR